MSDLHGTIHWLELMTRDVPAAKDFYAALCGWTYETMQMPGGAGDYVVASLNGRMVAGIFDMTGHAGMEQVPPNWFLYIAVDDVDASAASVAEAGGTLQRPPFDIAGVGRIAIVTDPAGAPVGLMTPVSPPAA